ncbi:MAG: hypothetical protein EB127_03850 [Alphaproteobacteria bacterium]|nr:hypothetical protein [Alphaproteobacteria bacterium]
MKQELQDELFKKYPDIFCQRHLPMTQTCMCWGIDTGDGWYQIIDELCAKIQEHVIKTKKRYPKFDIQATQVKEKMGGLRFYLNYSDDYIDNLVQEATKKSYKTCDLCGAPGYCASYRRWWMTLCKEHSNEHIAKAGYPIDEIYYEDDLPEEINDPEANE